MLLFKGGWSCLCWTPLLDPDTDRHTGFTVSRWLQALATVLLRMAVDAWQRLQEVYRRATPAFSMEQGQHVCALQCPSISIEGQTLEVHPCIGWPEQDLSTNAHSSVQPPLVPPPPH